MSPLPHRYETTLEDKYSASEGWVYMTGTQALVRLPLQQRLRDQSAGLNTGGYVSGYRGSPMGRYDMELWAAEKALKAANVVFRPGLNEDLAATAIWGSQYVGTFPGAKVEGVFGIWYGKGPGVDRSGDVLRHANLSGSSAKGGVLCIAGDDHGAKSSTVANYSDPVFISMGIPVLYPSNTQELLDFGLHGIALSRFSGCWVGMKVVTDVVEGGASVQVSLRQPLIVVPALPTEPQDPFGRGYNIRGFDMPLVAEDRLYHHKHQAVMAYARANSLNQITLDPPGARIGIISAGKSWQDVMQAFEQLGLSEKDLAGLGIAMLKVGMVWPLDPDLIREFTEGLETVVVVEEKRPLLEDQVRVALYGIASPPRLVGKHMSGSVFDSKRGLPAFPNASELTPAYIAKVLAELIVGSLPDCGLTLPTLPTAAQRPAVAARMPGFCSGCPHNRSTKVLDGSRALAGIGCHTMAMLADPMKTTTVSHMGAEGVMWLGQQPFTNEKHVFANIGDGTFAHSGFLAIRQALAARVPITYKLLYNGFVSMTGGQPVEGALTPAQITASLAGEGVEKMAVVTDDPHRYRDIALPPGVMVHPRTHLQAVEREFREFPGVSVILYDQVCATERRRLRKRGKLPDPKIRTFINAAVCEGCGDCGAVSNCMSIEPLETELGRKRKINQASCNKDYSCVEGFCPSFVTVQGGVLKTSAKDAAVVRQQVELTFSVPHPEIPRLSKTFSVLLVGIGGTGVVTVGQTLSVAAHVDGYYSSNLDVTGLAQKYGAVNSHVRFAPSPEQLHATRIGAGQADTLIAFDLMVGAGDETMSKLNAGVTHGVVSTDVVPTSEFAKNPDWNMDAAQLTLRLKDGLHTNGLFLEAQRVAGALLGDSIGANMLLLGAAWQLGQVPLSLKSIERAIELNGAGADLNKKAFLLGRRAAHDLASVERAIRDREMPSQAQVIHFVPGRNRNLEAIVRHRAEHLEAHTGARLSERYRAFVARVRAAEAKAGLADALSRAVAHNYHRLLAVKDEWEVARLYSAPEFRSALANEFQGNYKLHFHLGAWPFGRADGITGKTEKREVGPWMMTAMGLMVKFKWMRGTLLDPFRNSSERKLDKQLLEDYERDCGRILERLEDDRYAVAVELASLPEKIRGYGHVKEAAAQAARGKREALLQKLEQHAAPEQIRA